MEKQITNEMLEAVWSQTGDYEKQHFGLKYGADFASIAEVLRQNKKFMSLGMIMNVLASLEMSGIGDEMRGLSEDGKKAFANNLMDRPTQTHNTLAEVFYVGYLLGKQTAEIRDLESLTSTRSMAG